MSREQKRSFIQELVEQGKLTDEQVKQAREEEKNTGQRLLSILVSQEVLSEKDCVDFISERLDVIKLELEHYEIAPYLLELIPEDLARKYNVFPVFKVGNRLTCAMFDPMDIKAIDELSKKTGLIIESAVCELSSIKRALDEHYAIKGTLDEVVKSVDVQKVEVKEEHLERLEVAATEPSIVKLVNLILIEAIKKGASDIHIVPESNILKTIFRIDGVMCKINTSPKHLHPALVSRIKIMSDLNISERRAPQDGRFNVVLEGREINMRVSCIPTVYGESVVLRILDVTNTLMDLKDLGFQRQMLEQYKRLLASPHGIILVTGPTGSGKSTTLYSSLDKIDKVEKNVVTIEDPVEYKLAGIRQIQVNPIADLTFAAGLRAILRHDPDIIMIGEIRDFETAQIAVQAALTGHLVFSTLHTNDAASAVTRLIDMGIEPYLISSSVIGVLAQRLVRKICNDCRCEYHPSESELLQISSNGNKEEDMDLKLFKGNGCRSCMNTGYKGRLGIYELMIVDDKIRDLITNVVPSEEIKKYAMSIGMSTLKQDGFLKVNQGITTVEDVLRVTQEE